MNDYVFINNINVNNIWALKLTQHINLKYSHTIKSGSCRFFFNLLNKWSI